MVSYVGPGGSLCLCWRLFLGSGCAKAPQSRAGPMQEMAVDKRSPCVVPAGTLPGTGKTVGIDGRGPGQTIAPLGRDQETAKAVVVGQLCSWLQEMPGSVMHRRAARALFVCLPVQHMVPSAGLVVVAAGSEGAGDYLRLGIAEEEVGVASRHRNGGKRTAGGDGAIQKFDISWTLGSGQTTDRDRPTAPASQAPSRP